MPRLPPELASGKTPNSKSAISALGQSDNIAVVDEIGKGKWTTLYEYQCREGYSRCFYSALLSIERVSSSLEQSSWDISIGDGAPGFSQYFEDGRTITTYHRHSLPGIEPIIYSRNFHDLKPRQFDLSEEFRLFHNLYHDRNNDRFIHLDNRGNEFVAVEVAPGRVRVLTRLLQQYLAARQCALALFFDHRVDANVDAATARTTFPAVEVATADRRYSFHVGEVTNGVISRLIGKKIMPPPSITEAGIWPYETTRDDKYAEFIIGISDDGTPAVHNCNPAGLANYFGANEHAPHYLTPVWFSRDVLTKYYDDPDKFSVEDGYLRCGALWGIRIDNNLPDHVVVYLGDLGRDLSYDEQMYWKYFNISPGEGGTSVTNFKRSFLAQFSDPSSPDLVFKQNYTALNQAWIKKFEWPIFRTLHHDDGHIFKQFRVPLSESLGEFENQFLYLVKLLIDSLNEVEFEKACGGAMPNESGGSVCLNSVTRSVSGASAVFRLPRYAATG